MSSNVVTFTSVLQPMVSGHRQSPHPAESYNSGLVQQRISTAANIIYHLRCWSILRHWLHHEDSRH